jgi:outer membrane protein assembly factor BamB
MNRVRPTIGVVVLLCAMAGTLAVARGAAAGNGDAVAYQIDPAHSGVQTDVSLAPPYARRWTTSFSGPVSYPLIAGGRVFITAESADYTRGIVYALDPADGHVLWSYSSPTIYGSGFSAYDGGRLFVINSDGSLYTFDAATGVVLWNTRLPGQYFFSAPPTAADGVVYVGGSGSGGTLYAVDEGSGRLLASAPLESGDVSSPTLAQGDVFVAYPCVNVWGFHQVTLGFPVWTFFGPCSGGGGETAPYSAGRLFVADGWGHLIFDAGTGAVLGSFGTSRQASVPAVDGDMAWFVDGGPLVAENVSTGSYAWSFVGDGALWNIPPLVISNGFGLRQVVALSSGGNIYALDGTTGRVIWQQKTIDQPLTFQMPAVVAGGGLLLVPGGSQLAAYESQSLAKCDLSGYPSSKGVLNLKNANLAGCYLPGAQLAGANATNANAKDAYLATANLSGANLSQARLARAVLDNANLSGAKLSMADLNGASLAGANLTGATFSQTTCPDGSNSNANGGTCLGHLAQ